MQRVQIVATGVDGRVALLPLLWQTISVTHLEIGDVVIHVLPHIASRAIPGNRTSSSVYSTLRRCALIVGHAELISPGGTTLDADQLQHLCPDRQRATFAFLTAPCATRVSTCNAAEMCGRRSPSACTARFACPDRHQQAKARGS